MHGQLVGIALALLGVVASAELLESPRVYLTEADKTRILGSLKAAETKGTYGDTKKTVLAFSALKELGEKVDVNDACKNIRISDNSISDLYYAATAGCKLKLSQARIKTLQAAIDGGEMADAYMAVSAVSHLSDEKKVKFDGAKVLLKSLKQPDGTYKASENSGKADAASTAYALKLTRILDPASKASAEPLLKLGKAVGGELYFTVPSRNRTGNVRLPTTSLVLETALASTGIKAAQISSIASFLLGSKYVRDVEDIYHLVHSLNLCAKNKVHIPVVVSIDSGVVKVTDVKGDAVSGVTTALVKATNIPSKNTIKDSKLGEDGSLPKMAAGVYSLEVQVVPEKEGVYSKQVAKRRITVKAKVVPKSAALYVTRSSKITDKDLKHLTKYPQSISEDLIVDESEHYLHLKFGLAGEGKKKPAVEPDQVFVQFTHVEKGKSAVFLAQTSGNVYGLKMNLGGSDFTENTFGPGLYHLSIIVGGALLEKSYNWKIAELQVKWPSENKPDSASESLAAKPEIRHIFQQPARRPNVVISLFFTVVVLAPLAIVYVGIGYLRLELKFPSGTQRLWAMGFLGSLIAYLILNVMYFLVLNIFQALAGLGIVSVVATLAGNRALNFLNAARKTGSGSKKND
mmetsp:Transcript_263/g.508  ORF Transcript_263/g.508 Transcript_263/m.508 type:complete len:631 (+) Transcript_263:34-1926(+)